MAAAEQICDAIEEFTILFHGRQPADLEELRPIHGGLYEAHVKFVNAARRSLDSSREHLVRALGGPSPWHGVESAWAPGDRRPAGQGLLPSGLSGRASALNGQVAAKRARPWPAPQRSPSAALLITATGDGHARAYESAHVVGQTPMSTRRQHQSSSSGRWK